MPQWDRDRARLDPEYPDERLTLACPPRERPLLLRYDHHVVWIAGREALLLTYAWNVQPPACEEAAWPFELSFTYARGHPRAPAAVQQIIDTLVEHRPQQSVRDGDLSAQ
jgi:hypothetical protein